MGYVVVFILSAWIVFDIMRKNRSKRKGNPAGASGWRRRWPPFPLLPLVFVQAVILLHAVCSCLYFTAGSLLLNQGMRKPGLQ